MYSSVLIMFVDVFGFLNSGLFSLLCVKMFLMFFVCCLMMMRIRFRIMSVMFVRNSVLSVVMDRFVIGLFLCVWCIVGMCVVGVDGVMMMLSVVMVMWC